MPQLSIGGFWWSRAPRIAFLRVEFDFSSNRVTDKTFSIVVCELSVAAMVFSEGENIPARNFP